MPKCVVGLPGGTDGPRPQIGREVVRSDSTWQCQGLPCAHGAVGCWARSCPLLMVPRLPGSSSLAVLWYPQALVAAGGTVALNCHLKQSTAWDSVHHTFAKRLGGAGGMAMAAGPLPCNHAQWRTGCHRCWSSPGWLSSALSLH